MEGENNLVWQEISQARKPEFPLQIFPDWIQALMISGVSIKDLYEDMPFLGVLLKKNQDIDTFDEIKTKGYSLRNW